MNATLIACPRCEALPGEPCRDRSGRERPNTHASRARHGTPHLDPYLDPAGDLIPPRAPRRPTAMLNQRGFTCPRCGNWSDELTARIVKDRDEWVHASCAAGEKAVANRRRTLPAADITTCHTCGGPLHTGNRTVNIHGLPVHRNGCPPVTRRRRPTG